MRTSGSPDDTELWRACAGGDEEAFGRLWDLHRDAIYRFALSRVANRFDGDFVIQH